MTPLNIDPNLLISILLFVIGGLVVVASGLGLLLMEAKKTSAKVEATLEASVARHRMLLKEHGEEIAMIEQTHQKQLVEAEKSYNHDKKVLMDIFAIADQERDDALKTALNAQSHSRKLQSKIDLDHARMSSWATGTDDTATAVRHALTMAIPS
jgi:hypothetical protein